MDFGRARPRPRGESVVPMINVVFLLLIFFVMTATIVPPDPFAARPPSSARAGAAERGEVLHLGGTARSRGAR
jgi:biopolymer transport protein ExbD